MAQMTASQAGSVSKSETERSRRKVRTGVVVSNKMKKTIVVRVDRLVRHEVYSRVIKRSTTFQTHDENNTAAIGDLVKIMETRPLSKFKRWRLVEIVRRASTAPPLPTHATEQPATATPGSRQPQGDDAR